MKFRSLLALTALSLALPAARADSFLEIVSASEQRVTTASNLVLGAGSTFIVGRLRAHLELAPGQRAFLDFSQHGASGLGPNALGAFGTWLPGSSPAGTTIGAQLAGGALSFAFARNGVEAVSNLGNVAWRDANFGIVLQPDRRSGWLLFEDARLGSDFDYDDMVVRFQLRLTPTAPVPEASTVSMALAGIALLAAWRRRRPAAR